jgi:hypothetical protein
VPSRWTTWSDLGERPRSLKMVGAICVVSISVFE